MGSGGERAPWTAAEFREGAELLLEFVSRHPQAGPRVGSLGIAARVLITDLGLELSLRPSDSRRRKTGHHLAWAWGRPKRATPTAVEVRLSSVVAARCAQGKQAVPLALARKEILVDGSATKADKEAVLDAVPVLLPLQKPFVALLRGKGLGNLLI